MVRKRRRKNTKKHLRQSKAFHRKVERLLKTSGFEIIESNLHGPGADIVAEADGMKFLVQCKIAEKEGRPYRGISRLIDEYATKRRKKRASRAILALSRYKLPSKYYKTDVQEEILRGDKVVLWTDHIISYYSRVSKAAKRYSKYSMFVDWNINKIFGKPIEIPAIRISQKKYEMFIFSMSPETLLRIAYVTRRLRSSRGYQRIVNVNRLDIDKKNSISDYLNNQEGIFPTNLVCTFGNDVVYRKHRKTLKIPRRYGSIRLIDGQHRLYGFCHSEPHLKKNYALICCGFNVGNMKRSHIRAQQQAKLFVTINQMAKNVSKNLLLDLYQMIGKKDRRVEVVKCLSKEPAFKSKIKILGKKGSISIATFALTAAMESLVQNGGELSKYIGRKGRKNVTTKECVRLLGKYFNIVSKTMSEWRKPDVYIPATDRGIRALLRLCPYVLEYTNGLRGRSKAVGIFKALKKHAELENGMLKGRYYGEGGADALLQEWIIAVQKEISDFGPRPRIVDEVSVRDRELQKAMEFLARHFSQFSGEVLATILYIDDTTHEYLKYIPNRCTIKIITTTTKGDRKRCTDRLARVLDKHPEASIRAIYRENRQGRRVNVFHRRWIADKNHKIDLDHDLKHDAQGKKHSMRVYDRPHLDSEFRDFKEYWSASSAKLIELLGRATNSEFIYPC